MNVNLDFLYPSCKLGRGKQVFLLKLLETCFKMSRPRKRERFIYCNCFSTFLLIHCITLILCFPPFSSIIEGWPHFNNLSPTLLNNYMIDYGFFGNCLFLCVCVCVVVTLRFTYYFPPSKFLHNTHPSICIWHAITDTRT